MVEEGEAVQEADGGATLPSSEAELDALSKSGLKALAKRLGVGQGGDKAALRAKIATKLGLASSAGSAEDEANHSAGQQQQGEAAAAEEDGEEPPPGRLLRYLPVQPWEGRPAATASWDEGPLEGGGRRDRLWALREVLLPWCRREATQFEWDDHTLLDIRYLQPPSPQQPQEGGGGEEEQVGVFVKRPVEAGTRLLCVPADLMFSLRSLVKDNKARSARCLKAAREIRAFVGARAKPGLGAKRGEVLGSTLSLALAMALERLDPSSRWQPYWHTLPRVPGLLPYISDEQAGAAGLLADVRAQVAMECGPIIRQLLAPMLARDTTMASSSPLTPQAAESLLWDCLYHRMSRALHQGGEEARLVPALDLINGADRARTTATIEIQGALAVVVSSRALLAGEEVLLPLLEGKAAKEALVGLSVVPDYLVFSVPTSPLYSPLEWPIAMAVLTAAVQDRPPEEESAAARVQRLRLLRLGLQERHGEEAIQSSLSPSLLAALCVVVALREPDPSAVAAFRATVQAETWLKPEDRAMADKRLAFLEAPVAELLARYDSFAALLPQLSTLQARVTPESLQQLHVSVVEAHLDGLRHGKAFQPDLDELQQAEQAGDAVRAALVKVRMGDKFCLLLERHRVLKAYHQDARAAALRVRDSPRYCDGCGVFRGPPAASLQRCAHCWSTYYCSKACQVARWPAHKKEVLRLPPDLQPTTLNASSAASAAPTVTTSSGGEEGPNSSTTTAAAAEASSEAAEQQVGGSSSRQGVGSSLRSGSK